MTLFLRRFFGALVFDASAFEDVEAHPNAMAHSLLVVTLAALAGVVCLMTGWWHLGRTKHPLLGLGALKVPTFALTFWGGSLFRMSIGAVPFLLPLLFQLGFGLNAFHAGMLVIAVFAGNLMMKPFTTRILRRYGFKPVLLVNGLLNALAIGACALLDPATPVAVIAAVLFVGGLTRSMQFTAINTMAYAEVTPGEMSRATTLVSVNQQLAISAGVATWAASRAASASSTMRTL